MIFLFLRIFSGTLVNVFQKKITLKGANSLFIVTLTYLFLTIVMLPMLFFMPLKNINSNFWITIIITAVLDAIGNIFLVKSLKLTELSIFGILNSFKPVIATILAIFMLKEMPNLFGIIGISIIIIGSLILTYKKKINKDNFNLEKVKGIIYRFAGIFFSASGAVYIKKAIAYSTPEISLFFWALFGLPFLTIPLILFFNKSIKINFEILKKQKINYFAIFVLYSLMQYFTILVFKRNFVGYSLAIFQLSSIISIIFGYKFFNEKNIIIKLISAFIMIGGALLILYSKNW
ncbi:MAG: hypothetical protein A2086_01055 [Spirochaetes bacterium GWD1_27_9]|nr:MAG: hypothetical protein A2Z98_15985 [Spirochaetes bacterium GWB1_27_13]OHD22665.1 MAG: hypothetical protein A2Y34_15695 [Spirochaetes bacterium GWC1_27_15]OHD33641.1 MAG: hypothetical protein A2086_01055 [Spirochaetes bacterium GWD1_27_9]